MENFFENIITNNTKSNQTSSKKSEFIKIAIDNLNTEDDMQILNSLYELSSNLSIAYDSIGEDSNCLVLLKHLLFQLDKCYTFPEIAITSMICINYLLDINPRFTSCIVKQNGIKSIINLTQNIEFIDLAESSIKCIEKMSIETPFILLENNAFVSVLNLIDFFDLSLKKSAINACYYMIKSVSTIEPIIKYILPAIPTLSLILKFDCSSDIEKQILESILKIFSHLLIITKSYYSANDNLSSENSKLNNYDISVTEKVKNIVNCVLSNGIIDVLIDVFNKYVSTPKVENVDNSNNINKNSNKSNRNSITSIDLSPDIIKIVIKILESLSNLSNESTDIFLNMNILETIYYILSKNIDDIDRTKALFSNNNQSDQTAISDSSVNFESEIISLLISFFPENNKAEASNSKIFSPNNKSFYFSFCEKILIYLINNIISIQSSSTTVQIFKLIKLFIANSKNEYIVVYINDSKLANICSKMLDSKDTSYVLEVLNLVNIIMEKVPENYIISFIREGVVDYIHKLIKIKKSDMYINDYNDSSKYLVNNKINYINSKYNINYNDNDNKNYDDFNNIINDEEIYDSEENNIDSEINDNKHNVDEDYIDNSNPSNLISSHNKNNSSCTQSDNVEPNTDCKFKNKLYSILDNISNTLKEVKKVKTSVSSTNSEINSQQIKNSSKKLINKNIEKKSIDKSIKDNTNKLSTNNDIDLKSENISKETKKSMNSYTKEFNKFKNNIFAKNITTINDSNTINISNFKKYVLAKDLNSDKPIDIIVNINNTANEIYNKYFSKEKVDLTIKKLNIQKSPIEILNKLREISQNLSNFSNFSNVNNDTSNNNNDFSKINLLSQKIQLEELKSLLIDKSGLTFFEIENSKLFENLCSFFDSNYIKNYNNIIDDENKPIVCINEYDKNIINKLFMFLSIFDYPKNISSVKSIINAAQMCITSMNCFKLLLYDNRSSYLSSVYSSFNSSAARYKVKMKYKEVEPELVCELSEDGLFVLQTLESFLKEKKIFYMTIQNTEVFDNIKENLLSTIEKEIEINNENKDLKVNTNKDDNTSNKQTFYNNTNDKNNLNNQSNITTSEKDNSLNITNMKIDSKLNTSNIKSNNENIDKVSNNTILTENEDRLYNSVLDDKRYIDGKIQFIEKSEITYFVEVGDKKLTFEPTWTVDNFTKELKNMYTIKDYQTYGKDIIISFSFNLNKEIKKDNNEINQEIENYNLLIEANLSNNSVSNYLSSKNRDNYTIRKTSSLSGNNKYVENYNYLAYISKQFLSEYNSSIINNPNLYLIKRVSPFLYIISLLTLAINNYEVIFNNECNSNVCANSINISKSVLENKKVSSLILKQSKDPLVVSTSGVPYWCKELLSSFNYLCAFNSRYLLFRTSTFDTHRSMKNLNLYLKNFLRESNSSTNSFLTNNINRIRVLVNRHNILESAFNLYNKKITSSSRSLLEFEFENEIGTGQGPNLEFYTCFYKSILSKGELWLKTNDKSAFPMPLSIKERKSFYSHKKSINSNKDTTKLTHKCLDKDNFDAVNKKLNDYKILGFIIARAIYDDRLIDFPISSLFWDLLLERHVSLDMLERINPHVSQVVSELIKLLKINNKKLISETSNDNGFYESRRDMNNNNSNDLTTTSYLNNVDLKDLGVSFILPGYSNFELKQDGDDILLDNTNINEYLLLLYDSIFCSGIKSIVLAFKEGFEKVFPIKALKCFTSNELEEIICGSTSDANWSLSTLDNYIITNHGYNKSSEIYNYLIKFMMSLNSSEKKVFILFITGCPRLPIGGLKNLNPKLTIVKKQADNTKNYNPDNYLPTVMT